MQNGILTLLAGAKLAPISDENITPNWLANRISFGNGPSVLSFDFVCSSVSEAAFYICGHAQNGWSAWKDKNNNRINIYKK